MVITDSEGKPLSEMEGRNGVGEGTSSSKLKTQRKRKFGSRSSALQVADGVDLTGRTVLITGTNSGIGVETARTLARQGAHVVMANRNMEQSTKLRDTIKNEKPDASVDVISVDLSSLQSVRSCAKEFISKGWPLHILILNAGVFMPPVKATADGYETTFGVNHLGHFYLTYLLLDKIKESAPARIVVVASYSHNHSGIKESMSTNEKLSHLIPSPNSTLSNYRLYSRSKMCNILMAMKLHRMVHSVGINVYSLHPGTMIATGISRSFGIWGRMFNTITRPLTKSLQQGAATTVYCAISEDVKDGSGRYYESCWDDEKNFAKNLARDEALQDALWDRSVEFVTEFAQKRPD